MTAADRGPLITAAALDRLRQESADVVIVDCRFDLLAPERGFAAYLRGHIPGARYAHLDKDLARPPLPHEGRHPLPAPDSFAATLGAWGIQRQSPVIVYDDAGGAIAARLWWMLGWLGHVDARILDGGLGVWRAAGLPLETEMPRWAPTAYAPAVPDPGGVVSTGELSAALPRIGQRYRLIDARARRRFDGLEEPIDPVPGHVPGAINLPFNELLDAEGRFRNADEIRALFALSGADRSEPPVVSMCGSGVTACHLMAARAVAGLDPGRLYVGSWSEWIRDASRPVTAEGH